MTIDMLCRTAAPYKHLLPSYALLNTSGTLGTARSNLVYEWLLFFGQKLKFRKLVQYNLSAPIEVSVNTWKFKISGSWQFIPDSLQAWIVHCVLLFLKPHLSKDINDKPLLNSHYNNQNSILFSKDLNIFSNMILILIFNPPRDS